MSWRRTLRWPALSGLVLLASVVSAQVRDIDGRPSTPFRPSGNAHVLFFVATDCPISNSYAPEIQRLCSVYGSKGVSCSLAYEDVRTDAAAVRTHLDAFGYRAIPAAIDGARTLADRGGASITPQAIVIDNDGEIRYRGRIDNLYTSLGKPRQQVTVHDLSDALDAVLAGRTVARPQTEAVGCFIERPASTRK